MNDLLVHYPANTDMDHEIRGVVRSCGGEWFGQMDFDDGRYLSFKFNSAKDFENAVGGLAREFDLKWMHTTGDEGSYSCHYKVR